MISLLKSKKTFYLLITFLILSISNSYGYEDLKNNISNNLYIAYIEPPSLTSRPKINDLYKSLREDVLNQTKNIPQRTIPDSKRIESKGESSEKDEELIKVEENTKLSNLFERTYPVNSDKLFSISLSCIEEMNFLLKFLDMFDRKIVAIDKSHNTILIFLKPTNPNSTIVKISAYANNADNTALKNNVINLVKLLNAKTKS